MAIQKLNFVALVGAMKAAGKSVLENVWAPIESFGTITTGSPSFLGRREYPAGGEYIIIRDGINCVAIGLAKGTPKDATAFEIKKLQASQDCEVNGKAFKAGDISFKAYAVVEEEE